MKRNTLLNLIALSSLLLVNPAANAVVMGAYMGLGGGVGAFKSPEKNVFVLAGSNSTTSHSREGLSGRAFIGANFDPYFGIEAGYARYARSLYQGTASGASSLLAYYPRAFDVVGKAYLPFGHTGLNLYGLAGAARVAVTTRYVDNGVSMTSDIATPAAGKTHTYKTRPIYGAGMSYEFTQQISTNIEYTQIRHLGKFSTNPYAIPDMDLLTLNFAYHFC